MNLGNWYFITLLILFYNSSFAQVNSTPSTIITFNNPIPMPVSCNDVFVEKGVPLQFVNDNFICTFTYFNTNTNFNLDTTRFVLLEATLSADLSQLGIIEKIEIDAFSICDTCLTVSLLNNEMLILEEKNTISETVETLIIENTTLSPINELKIFGQQLVNIYEIRIFADNSLICESTADSDNDYICDALDVCPNFDDSIDRDGNGKPDYCDNCELNRVIKYPSFAGENLTYSSVEQISSTKPIFDGAVISFDAGNLIFLDTGFEVELGAEFSAFAVGCTL